MGVLILLDVIVALKGNRLRERNGRDSMHSHEVLYQIDPLHLINNSENFYDFLFTYFILKSIKIPLKLVVNLFLHQKTSFCNVRARFSLH